PSGKGCSKMSPWLARRWYDTVFWSSFTYFTFGHSLRVIGRRNMPANGPVLVLANHQSFYDPVLIGLASRRYLAYLARDTLFKNKRFAALIESLDAIPIDNTGLGKDGLQATLDVLQRGKAVLVFPEGERTPHGPILPFKAGISLLIKRMHAPIVPVAIAGAYHAWPRREKLPKLSPLFLPPTDRTIAISIGKPIDSAIFEGMKRQDIMTKLEKAVAVEFEKANRLKRGVRGQGSGVRKEGSGNANE
ncbi:MAG: 1-acyl-sn-glycerol-3-phosphate acyltransferase, partial [Planctomycetes bacterium]|nr:1-acyl-sn-glycerol-3-phosphate acyltransferase [Planctomycetota bacterium]